MSLTRKKIKVYSKLVLVAVVALIIGLVILKNRNQRVTFWFFGTYEGVNVLWLLACTAAGSIGAYWIALTVFSVWRGLRTVRRESAFRDREQEQTRKAEDLAVQERRIDQKRSELLRGESKGGSPVGGP